MIYETSLRDDLNGVLRLGSGVCRNNGQAGWGRLASRVDLTSGFGLDDSLAQLASFGLGGNRVEAAGMT